MVLNWTTVEDRFLWVLILQPCNDRGMYRFLAKIISERQGSLTYSYYSTIEPLNNTIEKYYLYRIIGMLLLVRSVLEFFVVYIPMPCHRLNYDSYLFITKALSIFTRNRLFVR